MTEADESDETRGEEEDDDDDDLCIIGAVCHEK